MRLSTLTLFSFTTLSLLNFSCSLPAASPAPVFIEKDTGVSYDIEEETPIVGVELRAGHMTLSGYFIEKSPEVEVPPGGGWGYTQVAAKLDVPDGYGVSDVFELDHLRVMFTSDRIEWIGSDPLGNTHIFLSEEECLKAGLQCDDVIPGASESGYFESGGSFDERLAVTNVHCTPVSLPYELTITALVIDISYPIANIVSEESYLTIECVQKEQDEPENEDR